MNIVALMGRLTDKPEVRYTQGAEPLCIARYTVAVQRNTKDKNSEYGADFINCTAIGKNGEFAEKYFAKGMRVCVRGRWQTGSYQNKEGRTVYTNECLIEQQEFAQNKNESAPAAKPAAPVDKDGFMDVPEGFDEELPFG